MDLDRQSSNAPEGMPFVHWWSTHVVAEVSHRVVVDQVREDAGWSPHFAVMTLMSAGIAVLGLLLSSPAVVIGAMLISPLMGPLIGLGFAIATFDSNEIRRTSIALLAGIVLAVAFCSAIVLLSPLQTVTAEISSRTRPNLFDLLVALFAGIAGTYAMIRGRHGAIVGVAIATALMPPLAVMGFGLATTNWAVLAGSTLLFFTNLMTITIAAALLARLYGFARDLSPHQTRLQATLIVITLIGLGVPLALALRQIAWEAIASREARQAIASEFDGKARVSDLEIDYRSTPIEIAGTVVTPEYASAAEAHLRNKLSQVMHRPVVLSLDQIRAENASELQVRAQQSATLAAERSTSRLAERLALIAGVPVENVLIDRRAKRAQVRAAVLPDAGLQTYRALEGRVAAGATGWTVTLVPPPAHLPDIAVSDGQIDQPALATAIWAAQRLRLPIEVKGRREAADAVLESLEDAGVDAKLVPGGGSDVVRLEWSAPEAIRR
ncbi:MAG TPA: DUF389 domain-containing protein [Sphingomicrobium sp.]|jgi:uncharacterized hydrophobic protein (TIGR00271 family)